MFVNLLTKIGGKGVLGWLLVNGFLKEEEESGLSLERQSLTLELEARYTRQTGKSEDYRYWLVLRIRWGSYLWLVKAIASKGRIPSVAYSSKNTNLSFLCAD